ncbi:MAG: phenylalanine--tRNA ligase subunit alpha [Nitrospirae bacterium]|nr:phenylalanine--tRNA ligase subunit alpha [Nitrospirota bacterium]
MRERIQKLRDEAAGAISAARTKEELELVRVKFFGRKGGELTLLTKALAECPVEDRPAMGRLLNETKQELEGQLEGKSRDLEKGGGQTEKRLDTTFPGRRPALGRLHPLTQTLEAVCDVFVRMGFQIRTGPEIETDYNNFEALNIPKNHPARDMQDTFYLSEDLLLRTHTSPVQIRTMLAERPPIQIIAPGKVYRKDSDITHSPIFHQVEGLMVDRGIHMGHLKGVLQLFVEEIFGKGLPIRFRPSYFPFVEPGAEVDMQCVMCRGQGCKVCGGSGWLEILGAGMVHPKVLLNVGYDPSKLSGFAFGMGIERIAMLRHGISNIRLFYENDLRFLEQF